MTDAFITREQWFTLPLPLRKRWWHETDFSKKEPSTELRQAVLAALIEAEIKKNG